MEKDSNPQENTTNVKSKHSTKSHANRILAALARVYESDKADLSEVLQAARLAAEVLERRPTPRRKTEKEKLIEAALDPDRKKKSFGGKDPNKKPPATEATEGEVN